MRLWTEPSTIFPRNLSLVSATWPTAPPTKAAFSPLFVFVDVLTIQGKLGLFVAPTRDNSNKSVVGIASQILKPNI